MTTANDTNSSYELAMKIKSLMEKGVKNKDILEATGIKQTQLTGYKKAIRYGRIDELRDGVSLRKIISSKKSGQSPVVDKISPKKAPSHNAKIIETIENESNDEDITDYISYGPTKVKLDNPEIGRKSHNPDEGKRTFIEDGGEIKYTPLSEHIKVDIPIKELLARHMFSEMKMEIEAKERETEFV